MRYKKVLFLSKYDQSGASSRYRTYQYLPYISGVTCVVSPLFTSQYLGNGFNRSRLLAKLWFLFSSALKRIKAVYKANEYDFVVVEYELLPYFPAVLEYWLHWRNIPYIVDYDDALFHQYDHHPKIVVRKLLGNKIATVMKLSRSVIVGNAYLADYAIRAGVRSINVIPTVIDLARYEQASYFQKEEVFTIVWIGSPSTTKYLQELVPVLQEISQYCSIRLRLVGATEIDLPGIEVECLDWEQEKEVEHISQCHIGIMPLPDTPWARGKCGLKLIQYMACELPVIASPIGVNSEIVESNTGILASTKEEWIAAILEFYNDFDKVKYFGRTGKLKVEKQYCLQVTGPQVQMLLEEMFQN